MKKIKYLAIFLVTLAGGCKKVDDFLAEAPSKTAALQITTVDQLEQLLNSYTIFAQEANQQACYGTDDYYTSKAIYDARPSIYGTTKVQWALWDTAFLASQATTNITDGNYWANEFKKIFYANTVLEYLPKVAGGTAEQKANLKAEACLIRAYSYWELANTYCLPYTDATKNELGLPIRLSINFEENVERQPLSKVYEQIESDLTEALKTTAPLIQNGKPRAYRGNKAAANGFAARYWLSRFDYTKAIQYANAALAESSVLVNYNTDMRFSAITATFTLLPSNTTYTVQYPYTHEARIVADPTYILNWKEWYYVRSLTENGWWWTPSPDLLALYDQTNDLRYKYHMVKGYSYDRGMTNPSYDYPGYVFFYKEDVPAGPRTAEMLLIKAEAEAHNGNVGPAMDALNTLRASRMLPGSWVNLTATSKDDAITKVAQERRREMPFSMRWFDLRRYNNNEYPGDDVTLAKTFYPYTTAGVVATQPVQTYTLDKNSRRWAAPIPGTEIISGRGVLKQNTY